MTEPLTEEELVAVERQKQLCARLAQALEGFPASDGRNALALMLAQLCLVGGNPDRAFLESVDGAFGAFREMSNSKYRNKDPAVS